MSWDLLLISVPDDLVAAKDEERDWGRVRELGSRDQVVAALRAALPDLRFRNALSAVLRTDSYALQLHLGDDEPVRSVALAASGADELLAPIRRLCEATGWRALDLTLGEFVDFDQTPEEGLRRWREEEGVVGALGSGSGSCGPQRKSWWWPARR